MWQIRSWSTDTWTAITAVVAFAALVQPWVGAAWRRFFKRGSVDIYETGTFEVGFSAYGSTIGLEGTFRSRDRDMFVQAVTVDLSSRDKSSRLFEWGAFRNAKAVVGTSVGQSAEVAIEAPSSFMIAAVQPQRYNIIFIDVGMLQQARPVLEAYQKAWLAFVDKETDIDLPVLPLGSGLQKKLIQDLRQAHQKFALTQEYASAFQSLSQLFYWEAVTYQVILTVRTARPNRTYRRTWAFTLSPDDVSKLRENAETVLEELAQIPLTRTYLFAYPPYPKR